MRLLPVAAMLMVAMSSATALAQGAIQGYSTSNDGDDAGKMVRTGTPIVPGYQGIINYQQKEDITSAADAAMKPVLDALVACRPYQASMPNPISPSIRMDYQVGGLIGDRCRFIEISHTPKNQILQSCLFTATQRKDMAERGNKALQAASEKQGTCDLAVQG